MVFCAVFSLLLPALCNNMVWNLQQLQPFKATLALSLESAWAAFGGLVMLNERMDAIQIVGCMLMFVAVVFAQMPSKKEKKSTSN